MAHYHVRYDVKAPIPGWSQHSPRHAWEVSIDIGGKKVQIDHSTSESDMSYLAGEVKSFIGKKLVDNSAKPRLPGQRRYGYGEGRYRRY